jgi:hypothetical protein
LPGQLALGRGTLSAGTPLPNGNAVNGQLLFRQTTNLNTSCIVCHTLPAGLGSDMRFNGFQWVQVPLGGNQAHHTALVELERSLALPFKVQHLRNMFDKFGMDLARTNSRAGFGFSHDGSVDSLTRFIQDAFGVNDDKSTADLVAFLFAFTGSDLTAGSVFDVNRSPGLASLDTAAAAGRQITISNSASVPLVDSMITLANSSSSRVDLIVKGFKDGLPRGFFYDRTTGTFQSDRLSESYLPAALRTFAASGSEQTYTLVPRGAGRRAAIDRNADGLLDRDEMDQTVSRLALTGNSAAIRWDAVAGFGYRVQYKDDLDDNNWIDLAGAVAATNGPGVVADGFITNRTRFYRVVPLP